MFNSRCVVSVLISPFPAFALGILSFWLTKRQPSSIRIHAFAFRFPLSLRPVLHSDLPYFEVLSRIVSTKQFLIEQLDSLLQPLKTAKHIEASIRTGQQPSASLHPRSGPSKYKSLPMRSGFSCCKLLQEHDLGSYLL